MICPACHADIPGHPKFCPECGTRLPASASSPGQAETAGARICPQCGTENPPTARFCRRDGYRFVDPDQPAAAPWAGLDDVERELTLPGDFTLPPHPGRHAPETEVTRPGPSVRCPRCGTMNAAGARFCRKDGYLLQAGTEGTSPGQRPLNDPRRPSGEAAADQETGGGLWRTVAIGTVVAGIVLGVATAGVFYWQGSFGNRQSSVEASINAELGSKGLSNVRATVGKDWVVTASGTVTNQTYRDQALEVLKRRPELKSVVDTIQVVADPAEVAAALNKAIADAGLKQITAQVMGSDKGLVATLSGNLNAGEEPTLESVLNASPMIREVRRTYQVAAAPAADPMPTPSEPVPPQEPSANISAPAEVKELDSEALQQRITDRLRSAGFADVFPTVDAEGNVTLAGTVSSHADDNRVVQLVLAIPDVAGVDDKLRVKRPPASTISDQPATPPKPARDPAKLEGDINRALRNDGIDGITAQVGDDFTVTLKGSTTSDVDKDLAFGIAQRFKGVKAVKDKIFVVGD